MIDGNRRVARNESLISRANREVSVFDVLEEFFNVRHPRDGRSFKGYCPFVWEHYDGGADKGFRTYPGTNTAYCFVQHGSLTPVRLIAISRDWTLHRSARWLLEHYGKLKPKDWQSRWAELTEPSHGPELGSPAVLVDALHTSLADHPNYPTAGLSAALSAAMEPELEMLARMYESPGTTEAEVRIWFDRAKQRLRSVLDAQS
jgi:hypothetical protein